MTVKMYLLGDTLDDVRLRNKASKALMRHITTDLLHPNASDLALIWEKTLPESRMRKLMVDATAMRLSPKVFERKIDKYPAGLVQQVAVKLRHQTTSMEIEVFQAKLEDYLEAEDDS